jgi:hypothetical protein
VGSFSGGRITSDAGGLLLREVENATGVLKQFSSCFSDYRDPVRIEHSVFELLAQRIYALCLGYEDLNDHDRLRHDPLLGLLVGKTDLLGGKRKHTRDAGVALAGKSTLNRLERTPEHTTSRYHKIHFDAAAIDRVFTKLFLDAYKKAPKEIVLDLDATDDLIHGSQEGRFFHGYYGGYCYLPLYIFSGKHLLCARLRPSSGDPAAGVVDELIPIVSQIRKRWPATRILIRADSGFARDTLMSWCEDQDGVDYVLGYRTNERLKRRIEKRAERMRRRCLVKKRPVRTFLNFRYRTKTTWSKKRRIVSKVEHLTKGANARFIVTSLSKDEIDARTLYEKVYCARGEMENRIKEQQLDLFADRTSTATMRGNQLRLYISSVAYILSSALRRIGLTGSRLANSYIGTIRETLFKIGALVEVTTRRVTIRMSSGYPYADLFNRVANTIRGYNHTIRC